MKWQKKLNIADHKHLKETHAPTLKLVKENVEFQSRNLFPCWDCISIGRKLGIKVELTAFHARIDKENQEAERNKHP